MEKIKTILRIDHIGYAVKDMQSARECFAALGFVFAPVKEDAFRCVNVSVGKNGGGV